MSGLRSAIEEYMAPDLESLTDAELTSDATELARALDMLTHRLAMVAFEVARRGAYKVGGFLNVTRWLAVMGDMENGAASRLVRLGRTLSQHPETQQRSESRRLSQARIQILTRAARAHPDQYTDHEEMLLELAEEMTLTDFRRAIEHWTNLADSVKAEEDADQQREKSYLHASTTLDGMVKIDGLFDKERGETILTALDAAMTKEARETGASGDLRPASARRVDALHDICRQFLDHFPGKIGGNRPHVSLILDWETIMGRHGTRCDLARTGTITRETARRMLCDAEVTRFIVGPDGVPLDMGRSTRTVTPAQMRALAVRDGGCTWPGCDRPPEWCDAHHKIHWLEGGPTDLCNLCLYCRRHHVLVHKLEGTSWTPPDRPSSSRIVAHGCADDEVTVGSGRDPPPG